MMQENKFSGFIRGCYFWTIAIATVTIWKMNGPYKLLYSTIVVVMSISLMLILYFSNKAFVDWSEKKRLAEPCQHGISGAKHNSLLCEICTDARIKENNLRKQQADELAQQKQQDRQRKYDEWKSKIRLPEYLRQLHPHIFEKVIADLYRKMGYEVEETPYSADGGIDAFARKDGKTYLIQCKRFRKDIGEPIIRDLYGNIIAQNAAGGIVVTTGGISKKARIWMEGKPIVVIDIKGLVLMLRENYAEDDVVPKEFVLCDEDLEFCPRCGNQLLKVNSRRGIFWGCSSYPQCHFSKPIKMTKTKYRTSKNKSLF